MIKVGSEVGRLWVSSLVSGRVIEIHPNRHEILTKGKYIVRNGSINDPALVILYSKGSLVLKLKHEVQLLSKEPS